NRETVRLGVHELPSALVGRHNKIFARNLVGDGDIFNRGVGGGRAADRGADLDAYRGNNLFCRGIGEISQFDARADDNVWRIGQVGIGNNVAKEIDKILLRQTGKSVGSDNKMARGSNRFAIVV